MIKKPYATILLVILTATNAVFGQAPVKQNLAGIATITFQNAPQESEVPNGLGKFYKLAKPTNNYIVIVINIDTARVIIKSSKDLDLFYSGVVDGAADSTQNRKLLYTKQIAVDKYKAVEFKYLDASTSRKFTVYQRIVYLDQTLFMYNFTVYDDNQPAMNAERERFLNSFTVTKATAKQL
ncbi:hypothetical protein IDJ77_18565 [Mucilaginibacter sp. ZT4R22]|uniref:DUF1795 domain-containing protein n=1 Tax=Mucilaginibacter pankratovii TaxID=2772110 RepID=A0ABR7WUA0_9SPHI|nr:hypothetical protein [Mucilaginibacter pankratovii]MBD1365826.1 hypothetical protein [Mucilaginibacter pankratovii]